MKKLLIPALLAACMSAPLYAEIGVTITVGEPDFYGPLDIGDYPRPALIYQEPVLVTRVDSPPPPVYMIVPPGHAKNWNKHCHDYGYCGRPVYFVEENWYEEIYVPEYRQRHGHPGKGKGKQKNK